MTFPGCGHAHLSTQARDSWSVPMNPSLTRWVPSLPPSNSLRAQAGRVARRDLPELDEYLASFIPLRHPGRRPFTINRRSSCASLQWCSVAVVGWSARVQLDSHPQAENAELRGADAEESASSGG